MEDEEIIRALEYCINPKVGIKCPRHKYGDVCDDRCVQRLMEQSLDLINRYTKEVKRLKEFEYMYNSLLK